LSLSLLLGCSTTPQTIVKTEVIKPDIPVQARPAQLNMLDVTFRVINQDNLPEFLEEFSDPELVFIGMTVKDYENMSLNVADLKRYIEQQKEIIIYYENSVK